MEVATSLGTIVRDPTVVPGFGWTLAISGYAACGADCTAGYYYDIYLD